MVQYENLDEKEMKKNKRKKNSNKCLEASFVKLIIISFPQLLKQGTLLSICSEQQTVITTRDGKKLESVPVLKEKRNIA